MNNVIPKFDNCKIFLLKTCGTKTLKKIQILLYETNVKFGLYQFG